MPKMKKIASLAILTILIASLTLYLWQRRELLTSLENISLLDIVILSCLHFLILLMNGLFIKFSVAKFRVKLTSKEWFGLSATTAMSNYITPFSGGLFIRATYLKSRHGLQLSHFAALLAANYLVNFWVISLTGCIACLFLHKTTSTSVLITFFSVTLIVTSIFTLFPTITLPNKHKIFVKLNALLDGWKVIKSDKKLLFTLALITASTISLNAASFWYANHALNFKISYLAALLISLTSSFSVVIKLTPANLGIYETIITVTTSILGYDAAKGLTCAIIIRGTSFIPIFLFGTIFFFLLTNSFILKQKI